MTMLLTVMTTCIHFACIPQSDSVTLIQSTPPDPVAHLQRSMIQPPAGHAKLIQSTPPDPWSMNQQKLQSSIFLFSARHRLIQPTRRRHYRSPARLWHALKILCSAMAPMSTSSCFLSSSMSESKSISRDLVFHFFPLELQYLHRT